MEEKELAEFKNRILSLIVDKEDGADHRWLFYQFKIEGLTEEYLIKIIEQIEKNELELLSIEIAHTHHLRKTINTQRFLNAGGFVNQYESEEEAESERIRLEIQDARIKDLTEENLKIRNKLTQWKLLTHWIPIIVSLISLGFVFYSHFKPSNDSSKEQMSTKIENLEEEVKQLQNGLKQENDKLKNELFKAEQMVRVLEGS